MQEEISTIKVILHPLEKQKEIASHIFELRQKAKTLQQEGCLQLENAKQEAEQMIINK